MSANQAIVKESASWAIIETRRHRLMAATYDGERQHDLRDRRRFRPFVTFDMFGGLPRSERP
jgi:hypothetical protein